MSDDRNFGIHDRSPGPREGALESVAQGTGSEFAALTCRELGVSLPDPRSRFRPWISVLRGVDLHVPIGQVTALVGTNGAGKTTLLRALMGAVRTDRGSIRALDRPIGPASCARPPGMALVPDRPAFPEDWTADDVAVLHRRLRDGFDVRGFGHALRAKSIDPGAKLSSLSAGRATWFSFAHAMAGDPRLLLLDEPFARLDPLARTEMVDALRGLLARDEERSVLLSTHDLDGMERLVDHLVVLHEGRVALEGDVDALLEDWLITTVPSNGAQGAGADGSGSSDTVDILRGMRRVGIEGCSLEGLVSADDAVGLPSGSDLRRPTLQELVGYTLADASARTKESA